jgi:hypothetical protein
MQQLVLSVLVLTHLKDQAASSMAWGQISLQDAQILLSSTNNIVSQRASWRHTNLTSELTNACMSRHLQALARLLYKFVYDTNFYVKFTLS